MSDWARESGPFLFGGGLGLKSDANYCRVCGARGIDWRMTCCSVEHAELYRKHQAEFRERELDEFQKIYGIRQEFKKESEWRKLYGFKTHPSELGSLYDREDDNDWVKELSDKGHGDPSNFDV